MRLGIVTDSGCDLLRSFFDEYGITILPISFRSGDKVLVDQRDPAATQTFYQRVVAGESDHESVAFTKVQIEDLFLSRPGCDRCRGGADGETRCDCDANSRPHR